MTADDIRLLIDYHYWARDRLLAAVEPLTTEQYNADLGSSFPSLRDTLVHLYSAEWIWHRRLNGDSPAAMLAPDTFPDFSALQRAWRDHETMMREFLAGIGDAVDRVVSYRTTDGRTFAEPIAQILQHVVNHGSYHRGQVTTMLRQLKAAPPKGMDLIAFHRERSAAAAASGQAARP
jgi:uncharacterized damage-inducible protein DinB